jgi:hypothetical protein
VLAFQPGLEAHIRRWSHSERRFGYVEERDGPGLPGSATVARNATIASATTSGAPGQMMTRALDELQAGFRQRYVCLSVTANCGAAAGWGTRGCGAAGRVIAAMVAEILIVAAAAPSAGGLRPKAPVLTRLGNGPCQ